MFDEKIFLDALSNYKKDFATGWWQDEKFKWEAVKCFQDNWNIDAEDFPEMLKRALTKTYSLLASMNNFPRQMIEELAQAMPDRVKMMFTALFDDKKDVVERILHFKEQSEQLLIEYGYAGKNHYQNENAISTYLWLMYPDKYYIYKFGEIKSCAEILQSSYKFKKGAYEDNLRNFYSFYDELCIKLQSDAELKKMLADNLTEDCYPDQTLHTLTMDFGFYTSRKCGKKENETQELEQEEQQQKITSVADVDSDVTTHTATRYWWLNANPRVWSFSNIHIGEKVEWTFYNSSGNKRRIFKNFEDAKVGDVVIGYESNPVKQIVCICKIADKKDGKSILVEKTENLDVPIEYSVLKSDDELSKMEYLKNPLGSLFKLTKDEYIGVMDLISEENPSDNSKPVNKVYSKDDFLAEVYMTEAKYNRLLNVLKRKKNIILQGAPGVGKTFAAKRLAYAMMGEKDNERIEFIQFHQNYSYEDFIMGYKPTENGGFAMQYGVFYRFCKKAENNPEQDYFFIIDEINRGNMSKVFGELLLLIEKDYRGTSSKLAYQNLNFSVPKNIYIIGMMNTADRSLAMIDYALRRRFSFFDMEPGFETSGFKVYQEKLASEKFNALIECIQELNAEITDDPSLGKGFCIGHSYFCGLQADECTQEVLEDIVEYDILPMLSEYWFDNLTEKVAPWSDKLHGTLND